MRSKYRIEYEYPPFRAVYNYETLARTMIEALQELENIDPTRLVRKVELLCNCCLTEDEQRIIEEEQRIDQEENAFHMREG